MGSTVGMRRTVETSHLFKIRSKDIVPDRTEEMIKVRGIMLDEYSNSLLLLLLYVCIYVIKSTKYRVSLYHFRQSMIKTLTNSPHSQ